MHPRTSILPTLCVTAALACNTTAAPESHANALAGMMAKPNKKTKKKTTKTDTKPTVSAKDAGNGGAAPSVVDQIEKMRQQLAELSDEEWTTLQCRYGRMFQARKPLVLEALREANANKKQLKKASAAVDEIAADLCKGHDPYTSAMKLGRIADAVNDKLTRGTALAGHDLVFEGFTNLMVEFGERCLSGEEGTTVTDLARMTDSQFGVELDRLAMGRCTASAGGSASPFSRPKGGSPYAECVREAFANLAQPPTECSDIVGTDPKLKVQLAEIEEKRRQREQQILEESERLNEEAAQRQTQENLAAQDAESHALGEEYVERGEGWAETGLGFMLVGGVAIGTVAGAPVGAALFAAGVAIFVMGEGQIMYGREQMDEAEVNYVEHTGELWSDRHCPSFSTPAGSLGYAASSPSDGHAPQMTVMDAMRACRCENDPLDAFVGSSGGLGAFGGPSCELGDRLRCLREAGNDAGGPSLECMQMLRDDNQPSLAAQLQDCSVTTCGPDSMIGTDCNCAPLGSGAAPSGAGFDPCQHMQVQCTPPSVPVPNGSTCGCEDGNPTAPPLDSPGIPVPGGLEGPGGIGGDGGPKVPGGKGLPQPGLPKIPRLPR